jgi:type 1 glutamine amidotransferase
MQPFEPLETLPMPKCHVVYIAAEDEYLSERSLSLVARELQVKHGISYSLLLDTNNASNWKPEPGKRINFIPGLEALQHADLLVGYFRFRTLPEENVAHLERYLDSGRPVVGFRTTTHGFNYAAGDPLHKKWNAYGAEVLGAPWIYHYGHESSTDVRVNPDQAGHPILKDVPKEFHTRSWLYHVQPEYPPKDSTTLLIGKSVGPSDRKERVDNPVAWTRKTKAGGRVFTTTLGHPEDFTIPAVRKLVDNGILWALGRS